MIFIDNEMKLL